MKKKFFTSSALALTVCLSAPAFAQSADSSEDEIVVTAQFRQQNLQDVPIAADVVSASELVSAGATDLNNVSRLVPSLQIGPPAGPGSIIFVRGIGSLTTNSFTDPSVGVSYDGVPLARPYSVNGLLYDLQRVEVLKGPQGTLFGRNAMSGALNIVPRAAELGATEGSVGIDVGNYSLIRLNGAFNAALGDRAAIRGAFQGISRDGYNSDDSGDEESEGARVQARFDPSTDVALSLGVDYFHLGGVGTGGQVVSLGYTPEQRVGPEDPRLSDGVGGNDWPAGFRPFPRGSQYQDNTHWGVTGKLDWSLPIGTLTVIPAYRHDELNYFSGGPGLGLDYRGIAPQFPRRGPGEENYQTSLEARLASPDDQKLTWVVGGYGLSTESKSLINIDSRFTFPDPRSAASSFQVFKSGEESWAAFADGTFNVSDTFRLIGGVRYTDVEKSGSGSFTTGAGSRITLPAAIETIGWVSTTYRAGAQWDVTENSMFYGSVSTGWHAGGYSFFENGFPGPSLDGRPQFLYEPEEITAYTIGSKNRLLDGRLLANLELFHWNLTDQQVSAVNLSIPSGGAVLRTFNVGQSTVDGAELEVDYRIADNTRIGAQVQYLHNVYDDLVFFLFSPTGPAPGSICRQSVPAFPPASVRNDCSGVTAPQSPDWTANVSLEQTFPLSSGASIVASIFGHFESERRIEFDFTPNALQKSTAIGDAALDYNSAGGRWTVTAYVNNFTDEAVIHNQFTFPPSGVTVAEMRPPRTYGVRLTANF